MRIPRGSPLPGARRCGRWRCRRRRRRGSTGGRGRLPSADRCGCRASTPARSSRPRRSGRGRPRIRWRRTGRPPRDRAAARPRRSFRDELARLYYSNDDPRYTRVFVPRFARELSRGGWSAMSEGVFDLALLLIRTVLGGMIFLHGYNHLFGAGGVEGTARWFASLGFRPAKVHALMSGYVELAAGVGLLLGLLNALACAALIGTMCVA